MSLNRGRDVLRKTRTGTVVVVVAVATTVSCSIMVVGRPMVAELKPGGFVAAESVWRRRGIGGDGSAVEHG